MEQTVENTQVVVDNAAQVAQKSDWLGMIIYCAVVFAIIYFFMVRPNKKRMAEYQKMLDAIKVGNRVLAGGIYGKVVKINDKTVEMEIAKGVVIEVNKNAIANVEDEK
ncbi:MAG: preprotein translocase subunit YajC [Alphaproteobacteria bacterium]